MESQNNRTWSYAYLYNFRQISPAVQNHLKRVYLTLCCALLASAFGAYLHMLWNIGGIVTSLAFTGTFLWLRFPPAYQPLSKRLRLSLLFLSAVLKGASVGPMLSLVIDFDSSLPLTTFVGTAVVFVCFSAVAMFASRRECLYLGASFSCCMAIRWCIQFASWIFGSSTFVFFFELYFGFFIFMGYIVVDTQIIIEQAHNGDMDYVQHSLSFFIEFANLFRPVIILNIIKKLKKGRKYRN